MHPRTGGLRCVVCLAQQPPTREQREHYMKELCGLAGIEFDESMIAGSTLAGVFDEDNRVGSKAAEIPGASCSLVPWLLPWWTLACDACLRRPRFLTCVTLCLRCRRRATDVSQLPGRWWRAWRWWCGWLPCRRRWRVPWSAWRLRGPSQRHGAGRLSWAGCAGWVPRPRRLRRAR